MATTRRFDEPSAITSSTCCRRDHHIATLNAGLHCTDLFIVGDANEREIGHFHAIIAFDDLQRLVALAEQILPLPIRFQQLRVAYDRAQPT